MQLKFLRSLVRPSLPVKKTVQLSLSEQTWQEMSKNLFKDSNTPKSGFLSYLADFKQTLNDNSIVMPEDVQKAYSTLSDKATLFADRISASISRGNTPKGPMGHFKNEYYYQKFISAHSKEFYILQDFMQKQRIIIEEQVAKGKCDLETLKKFKNFERNLSSLPNYSCITDTFNYAPYLSEMYDPRISDVGQNIINPSQYLYHGTHSKGRILKEGFSLTPKTEQAKVSREIGKAVYLTPKKGVAAFFAGNFGNIIKTKANINKIAVINNEQSAMIGREIGRVFKSKKIDPEVKEEVIAELFKRNGYDAVYTKNCLNDAFAKMRGHDIDYVIGESQSQVAVFDPSKINICKK